MPRQFRAIPEDVPAPDFSAGIPHPPVLADLNLLVTTPMFGGGTEPGKVDEDMPIRAPAIRGSLRYWWRACNISGYDDLETFKADERKIWGSGARDNDPTYGPGAISLRVEMLDGKPTQPFDVLSGRDNDTNLGYVLFPFTEAKPPQNGLTYVRFRLIVTFAPHAMRNEQLHKHCTFATRQALWAWIAFGGVGARTRRGCGSLFCVDDGSSGAALQAMYFKPNPNGARQWLEDRSRDLVCSKPGSLTGPSLHESRVRVRDAYMDRVLHLDAWSNAITPYRDFRQGQEIGRNKGKGNRPGQSRWPEPGAIRNLLGLPAAHWDANTKVELTADQEMHDYFVGSDSDGGDFPKADFGLPILFQNMAGMEVGTRADGSKIMKAAELSRTAKNHTRFASPLIVKALAVTEARSVPISLMLNTPHVWELPEKQLTLKHPRYESVSVTTMPMREADMHWPKGKAGSFKRPPHVADEGVTSIRDAYLAYLTDEGWAGATLKPTKSE